MATIRTYETDQLDLLRLSLVEGLGPRRHQALVDHLGSVSEITSASHSDLLAVPGIGPAQAQRIVASRSRSLDELLDRCDQNDIWMWFRGDEDYPELLSQIPDPPLVLFGKGQWEESDRFSVGIVGTRRPTSYGRRQAERLASSLAEAGLAVISGLALGIDGTAHRAALAQGGRTIAVLGSGLLKMYPREHQDLADQIECQGVVISESPPLRQAIAGAFPQRNRIISGLAAGIVVVEAAERSGALITARHAMEQGRDVFAVPGPIDSPQSRGCHRLLRDGAKLVESVDDILEEILPLLAVAAGAGIDSSEPCLPKLSEPMKAVYGRIDHAQRDVESLASECQMPISEVLSVLTQLELKRLVHREGPLHVRRRF